MEVDKREEQKRWDYNKQQTNIDTGDQDLADMKQDGFLTKMEDKQMVLNRNGSETHGDLLMHNPCINTSTENCKDKSDSCELLNDNSSCQLVNQTLRTKPLSSVNPSLERDSKLRVSVFDHGITHRRFISGRISLNRIVDNGGSDIECEDNNSVCSFKVNGNQNGKRKGLELSYAQLKRRNNSSFDSSKDSSPEMDKGSFRTQFDVLLRSLIGDVNDMQVDTSPMTISSGYESDYIQTKEADIDKIFKKNKENKENVEIDKISVKRDGNPTSYCPTSETFPKSEIQNLSSTNIDTNTPGTHGLRTAFSSLPSFPTQPDTDLIPKPKSKEAPIIRSASQDDSNEFSYAQRHNYKLTKVTRSMYEIIHDLQSGEKSQADNRKRSRKGRRSVQDGSANSDGYNSAKEIKSRGRLQSADLLSNNNVDTSSLNRNKKLNISGSVVRCVRRPVANDPSFQPVPRMPPRGEGNQRAGSFSANNNSDKVQNDLRNLLCSTSDVPLSSRDNNTNFDHFNGFSRMDNRQDVFKDVFEKDSESRFNQPNISINPDSNVIGSDGQRRLTLNQQFMQRPKPDEHVYETIPGDEKLYEEWKRLQATSKVPKIRRFTTVPDLPGTFVPKEPPALPERRYLSTSGSSPKETEHQNYIFMGDINANIPAKTSSERSDSGYASVASDRILDSRTSDRILESRFPERTFDSRFPGRVLPSRTSDSALSSRTSERMLEATAFRSYPYPSDTDHAIHHRYRSDEASDGYCSIDNISLCPETLSSGLNYQSSSIDRRAPPTSNRIPLPTTNRNDYFTNPLISRHSNSSFLNSAGTDFQSRAMRFGTRFFDHRKSDTSDSDQTLLSSAFDRDSGSQIVQGTYV